MSCEPMLDVVLDLPDRREGKVRVSFGLPDDEGGARRLFVTTDRLSAFDRIIAGVPYKGQVLNELAAWWFARTASVVPNHVLGVPDPNALVARSTVPLPVEVIVRGAITGVTVDLAVAAVRRRRRARSTATACPTGWPRTRCCRPRSSRRPPSRRRGRASTTNRWRRPRWSAAVSSPPTAGSR